MEDAKHYSCLLIEMGGWRRKKGKLTREDAQHYSGLLNAIPDISVRPWIPNYQIHFGTTKHVSLTHTYIRLCVNIYIYIYICMYIQRERERERERERYIYI